jgi:hypothetical protein
LADGCSRVKSTGSDEVSCDDAIPCFSFEDQPALSLFTNEEIPQAITLQQTHLAQKEEETCQTLIKDLSEDDSKFYIEQVDGSPLLYRQGDDLVHRQIYTPAAIRRRVMHLAHNPTISGHPRAKTMLKTMKGISLANHDGRCLRLCQDMSRMH